ncbi:MAG: 6,7-dimethyl-8-ribityllumazine synthase [Acidimicrobiales bacterium]
MAERHGGIGAHRCRVAFIRASWHEEIVECARRAFDEESSLLGLDAGWIDHYRVPGAFEIPLHAQHLAGSGRYAAVVAAGLVVDGGVYRHEFVARAVVDGLMRVQLDSGVPVISAVLTPHQFHEHETHIAFFADHLAVKGREAARACVQTIESLDAIVRTPG